MHIADKFPNLQGSTQDSTNFDLYQHVQDSWSIVFVHPGDFTPVCTTELGGLAEMQVDFKNRGIKLIGFSCNDATSHRRWIRDIEHVSGHCIEFPLFCDVTREYSIQLGILDETNKDRTSGLPMTVRGTFVLRPDQTVALMFVYPSSTGRNLEELLRVVDSLLLTQQHTNTIATPANWKDGDDVLVANHVDDDQAEAAFGKEGYRIVSVPSEADQEKLKRHYFRFVKGVRLRKKCGGGGCVIC